MKIKNRIASKFVEKELDFEKEIIMKNCAVGDWQADILVIDGLGFSHEYEVVTSAATLRRDRTGKVPTNQELSARFFSEESAAKPDFFFNTFTLILPEELLATADPADHVGIISYKTAGDEVSFETSRMPQLLHYDSFWKVFDKEAFIRTLCKSVYDGKKS